MPVAQRVLQGQIDFQGQTVGQLFVGDIVSRLPLRWSATCTTCGTSSTVAHKDLVSGIARCGSSICGKVDTTESLADYRRKERQRAERLVARREAEQRELQAAAAARLTMAEAELTDTARQLGATIRQRLTTQKDDRLWIDPKTQGYCLGAAEQDAFNREEAAAFLLENPGAMHLSPSNHSILGEYFDRNAVQVVSRHTLAAAVSRLKDCGLLQDAPAPDYVAPAPEPAAAPIEAELMLDQSVTSEAQLLSGFDPATGSSRTYTPHEVERMSADAYRRAFRISSASLALPTRSW